MPDDNEPTLPFDSPAPWQQRDEPVPFEDMPKNSEKIWAAAAPEPARPPTPREMIVKTYGARPGKKRGQPDTRAAADALGVHPSTVRRWIRDRKLPDSPGGKQLRQQHQAWRNSAAGRKSALGRKRKAELRNTSRITFTGFLKISKDVRKRHGMQIDLDPAEHQALMDSLIEAMGSGDDDATHTALEELISGAGNWGGDVHITIDTLSFS